MQLGCPQLVELRGEASSNQLVGGQRAEVKGAQRLGARSPRFRGARHALGVDELAEPQGTEKAKGFPTPAKAPPHPPALPPRKASEGTFLEVLRPAL